MPSQIIPASPQGYARAADILREGGLVALPTETVYGLAGDATNPDAVAAIYALKGRPASNPLITHIQSPAQAGDYALLPPLAQELAARVWPGPLTLVLDRKPNDLASDLAAGADADFPTIALRCPDASWRAAIPIPLVMPSANRSGNISPTTARHVLGEFPDGLLILDGGPCPGGIESTVLRVTDTSAHILRPGGLTASDLGIDPTASGPMTGSPGLLTRHYAPSKPLRLNATSAGAGDYLIGFGDIPGQISLGTTLTEAAHSLYAALRTADASDYPTIAIAPIPAHGIGLALNDRLARASRGR